MGCGQLIVGELWAGRVGDDDQGWRPAYRCPGCRPPSDPTEAAQVAGQWAGEHRGRTQPCAGCGRLCHFWTGVTRFCTRRAPRPPSTPAAGPAGAAQHRTWECADCRRRFRLTRADSRWCSPACRQRAYRRRAGAA